MAPRDSFRFAERCLYEFQANRARLLVLRDKRAFLDKMCSAKAQNYELGAGSGVPSDAVSKRVERLEDIEANIQHIEGRVKPIERLLEDLEGPHVLEDSPKAELLKILRLYYFGNNVWQAVVRELNIRRTTFFKRRDALVNLAITYLGL